MKYLWSDTKRIFGLPISFTKYSFNENRLFKRSGLLVRKEDQVSLYHIRDLSVEISLGQRIFGVGTVTVISVDKSDSVLKLENIKNPYGVREALYEVVEDAQKARGMRYTELTGDGSIEDFNDFE